MTDHLHENRLSDPADHHHDRPSGLGGFLREIFPPHAHDPADTVDTALLENDEGIRALKISLVALVVTAALQMVVVFFSRSVALLADTIHNLSDALTALPLWIAFALGRRPPNKRYNYGYGRAEDLAGVFIVAVIALSAAVAGWESLRLFWHPQQLRNVGWVAVAGLIGFAGNELVAVYRIRVGHRIGSAALVADGLHARTDGVTSLGVLLGAIGVAMGFPLADPIVGLAITVAILFLLKSAARDIYRRLMDSVDPKIVDEIADIIRSTPGVESVGTIRVRWIGRLLHAEVEIVSDAGISLAAAHRIGEEAHHRLLHGVPRLSEATIHSNPSSSEGQDHHAQTAHHRRAITRLR